MTYNGCYLTKREKTSSLTWTVMIQDLFLISGQLFFLKNECGHAFSDENCEQIYISYQISGKTCWFFPVPFWSSLDLNPLFYCWKDLGAEICKTKLQKIWTKTGRFWRLVYINASEIPHQCQLLTTSTDERGKNHVKTKFPGWIPTNINSIQFRVSDDHSVHISWHGLWMLRSSNLHIIIKLTQSMLTDGVRSEDMQSTMLESSTISRKTSYVWSFWLLRSFVRDEETEGEPSCFFVHDKFLWCLNVNDANVKDRILLRRLQNNYHLHYTDT